MSICHHNHNRKNHRNHKHHSNKYHNQSYRKHHNHKVNYHFNHYQSIRTFLHSIQIAFVPTEQNLQVGGNVTDRVVLDCNPEQPRALLAITGITMAITDCWLCNHLGFSIELIYQFLVISIYQSFSV